MKDTMSLVLVLIIATISLNNCEKIKPHHVSGYGMVDRPRRGRSPGMSGFARIDRASGLMSFPRVGRSDPTDYDVVFDFNPEDISEVKRQGLIPYPRVGRSHDVSSSSYGNEIVKVAKVKRTGDAVPNGGMWFGPRLGRLHRRGGDEQLSEDQQWAVYPLLANEYEWEKAEPQPVKAPPITEPGENSSFICNSQQLDNFSPIKSVREQEQQQQQQQQQQQHEPESDDGIQSVLNTGAIY